MGQKQDFPRRMELYKQGKNDSEIGEAVGVQAQTIYKWRKRRKLDSNHEHAKTHPVDLTPSGKLAYVDSVMLSDGSPKSGRSISMRATSQKWPMMRVLRDCFEELGASTDISRNSYQGNDYKDSIIYSKQYTEHYKDIEYNGDGLSWVTDKSEYALSYLRGAYECEGSILAKSDDQLQVIWAYQKDRPHLHRVIECLDYLDIPYTHHDTQDTHSVGCSGSGKESGQRVTSSEKAAYVRRVDPAIKTVGSTEYEVNNSDLSQFT